MVGIKRAYVLHDLMSVEREFTEFDELGSGRRLVPECHPFAQRWRHPNRAGLVWVPRGEVPLVS